MTFQKKTILSRYTFLFVNPNYLVAIGYPSQVKVTVSANNDKEAYTKARAKFDRMIELITINSK